MDHTRKELFWKDLHLQGCSQAEEACSVFFFFTAECWLELIIKMEWEENSSREACLQMSLEGYCLLCLYSLSGYDPVFGSCPTLQSPRNILRQLRHATLQSGLLECIHPLKGVIECTSFEAGYHAMKWPDSIISPETQALMTSGG